MRLSIAHCGETATSSALPSLVLVNVDHATLKNWLGGAQLEILGQKDKMTLKKYFL